MTSAQKIAVVGAGISGLGAAFALKDVADVTVFEAQSRLGGHANTITFEGPNGPITVDTGFIVFNAPNYPNFNRFLAAIDAASQLTDMSFGFAEPGGLEWSSYPGTIPLQLPNLARADFRALVRDWPRFNRMAKAALKTGELDDLTLGAFLDRHGFSEAFQRNYLLPMGAAIWSTTEDGMRAQPALAFVRFFNNHGLLQAIQPLWRTIPGGSKTYVKAAARVLGDRVRTNAGVVGCSRRSSGVDLRFIDGHSESFDEVIFACHSDEALGLLEDADAQERAYLGAIGYGDNCAVVHGDARYMPSKRSAWASWNYRIEPGEGPATITYNMNRLQKLDRKTPVFISLDPPQEPNNTYAKVAYRHPQFDAASLVAQQSLNTIQGVRRTWFAGAWTGYGFHEDGLRSGLRVALRLGGQIPWDFVEGDVTGGDWGPRPANAHLKLVAAE